MLSGPASRAPTGDAPALHWSAFPHLLVRLPAIPRSRLNGYRYDGALALHARARLGRARLKAEAEALSGRLARVIPLAGEPPLRRGLLAARRALFNLRALDDGPWRAALSALDPVLASDIKAWETGRHAWEQLLLERDALFVRDGGAADRALIALLEEPALGRALALANPLLAGRLARLPSRPIGSLSKDERRAVGAGARYLWRAALRPTPNGFFAGTALADLGPHGPGPPPNLSRRVAHVQPNRKLTRAFAAGLLTHAAVRRRLRLRLAPGSFADEEGCWVAPLHPDGDYRLVPGGRPIFDLFTGRPEVEIEWRALEQRGVEAGRIWAALRDGILEWGIGESEARVDDLEALSRILWEGLAADIALLTPLATLEEWETLVEAAASPPSPPSSSRPSVSEAPAQLQMGERTPLVYADTLCPVRLTIPPAAVAPFFGEIARFGAGLLAPGPQPEEESLVCLFRHLYPDEAAIPLLRFHRDYLRFCRRHGLGSDHWRNSGPLGALFGLPPSQPARLFHTELARLLSDERAAEVGYHPRDEQLAGWEAAGHMRLSFRFKRAPDGAAGPRFHPTLWGADRMSLFPRYAALPFPGGDLTAAVRSWMARWPDAADLYGAMGRNVDLRPPVTERRVIVSGAGNSPGALLPRDLLVAPGGPGGRLRLVERDGGRTVRPLFLGVSAAPTLPPLTQFLLHLAGSRASLLELLYRAVNEIILGRLHALPAEGVRLPSLYLGDHILLAPETFILPRAALPSMRTPVGREEFFKFHDWLGDRGLPRTLLQLRVDAEHRDPLWLDVAHPEGVNAFLRAVQSARAVMLYPPLCPGDEGGLEGVEGTYEAEYYAELAAGADPRNGPAE